MTQEELERRIPRLQRRVAATIELVEAYEEALAGDEPKDEGTQQVLPPFADL